jgi:hypothetical protein
VHRSGNVSRLDTLGLDSWDYDGRIEKYVA